jgi:predicted RNase H-like HicB family nuclease
LGAASNKEAMFDASMIGMPTYKLTATIWKEQKGYVAKCSELGVASASDSPSEVLVNLKEVTEHYLENRRLTDTLIPIKPFLQVSS